jgi:MFS family permease
MASLRRMLLQPLKDRNFRNVLRFLASWQFAVNLATPFFTVYFVRVLGFGMGFVLVLTVASQLANIAVVRSWGRLSDRFTNRSVIATAAPVFLLCIGGMAFAGEFAGGETRAAFLIALHIVMGAAGAGVSLASGNVVMKLSPSGAATSYMATNALVGALAAGVAPIVGGYAADFFARRRLEFEVRWFSPSGANELLGVAFSAWEFFFLLSALLGLYALHRLAAVEEPGSVEGREVVEHIWTSARRTLRNASSVAGLRGAVAFPSGDLIKSRERKPFVLERVFASLDPARIATPVEAMGGLLDATFEAPAVDGEFDDLLRKLDR